jgi:glucose-6-phosphate 1-dehydrogenase
LEKFLTKTYHIYGGYCNKEGEAKLNAKMEQMEVLQLIFLPLLSRVLNFTQLGLKHVKQGEDEENRMFYFSVPQEVLLDVTLSLADGAQTKHGWKKK